MKTAAAQARNFQLSQRAQLDSQKLFEFFGGIPTLPRGDIGRDRYCGSSHLIGQTEIL